ncbi:hypothetical protein TNIN_129631 [Trichonephila inaurata madagascariensis]|uniref:Uncharacterized protein n=1 Tax=Trichonephila inaurata madagascariensis TaxID=2747483 RepID=A0A8X6WT54_9ARAC|nr:hypothetical protein TNIN_129631 [Trichonephila inaurata madagascariensis]
MEFQSISQHSTLSFKTKETVNPNASVLLIVHIGDRFRTVSEEKSLTILLDIWLIKNSLWKSYNSPFGSGSSGIVLKNTSTSLLDSRFIRKKSFRSTGGLMRSTFFESLEGSTIGVQEVEILQFFIFTLPFGILPSLTDRVP